MFHWTLRNWFLSCIGVAILIGGWHEVWRPHRNRFVTKAHWIGPGTDEQMDRIAQILESQPPEISGKTKMRELVRILNDIYPTRLDPEYVLGDETLDNLSVGDTPMTLHEWLHMILEPFGMTCSIRDGYLHLTGRGNGIDRVYPCPVVDSRQLIRSLEARGHDWQSMGGLDTISVIDTDQQSFLVVRTDYATHRWLQRELEWYYQCSGIGWRTDRAGWQNLPRIVLDKIASWIGDETSATKATRGMGQGGFGCSGAFMSGS